MPRKTVKKSNVGRPRKVAAEKTVPAVHECANGATCHCECKCGKFRKFIVLLIVFFIGFAVAKMTCCHKPHHMPNHPDMHPVFVNGCLDIESVKCPKMLEMLATADANADGCVTVSEFGAVKHAMRPPKMPHPAKMAR